MVEDGENNDTPWGLLFLGIFFLFVLAYLFIGGYTLDQATYQPSKPIVFDPVETLFGSLDLSYKPGAALMSA